MKSKLILMVLFAMTFKAASSQCTNVTVGAISNFVPFSIDSVLESNGMRNGPDYNGATLYYPIGGAGSYKSIVLVPGYYATQTSIAAWGRFFASHGFVAMTIGTNNLSDQPNVRAIALLDGIETIKQENNRIASPLYNNLDTNSIAVGGWSMGGGGAQLAAVSDTRVKAVFAIAPWLNYSTLIPANLDHDAPVLILSGQLDPTAPPAQNANVHYNYTPATTQKVLFEIDGGNHFTPLYPSFGNGDVGRVAFAWMNLFLNSDSCYCEIVKNDSLNQNATASNFLTNINCDGISSVSNNISINTLSVFPNPFSTQTVLHTNNQLKNATLTVDNYFGQTVKQIQNISGQTVTLFRDNLPNGFYFVRLTEENRIIAVAKLVITD